MNTNEIPTDLLILNGIDAMYEALVAVRTLLGKESGTMLSEVHTTKIDNITREVDKVAEHTARKVLYRSFNRIPPYRNSLVVYGEESITQHEKGFDLSGEQRTVALLDMIDGTDLLNRGLSNWCSAMVFFYPPEARILATLVSSSAGTVDVASPAKGCFRTKLCSKTHFASSIEQRVDLRVPTHVVPLEEAGVCFYGQKARNLLSLFGSRFPLPLDVGGFSLEYMLTRFSRNKPPFRIYNFGGNPMMVKVADGSVQAVFELLGQKPHDVVPGAFIARMAGATVKDLEGNDLQLEDALLRPNEGSMRYIIASSEKLYWDLLSYLKTQSSS